MRGRKRQRKKIFKKLIGVTSGKLGDSIGFVFSSIFYAIKNRKEISGIESIK